MKLPLVHAPRPSWPFPDHQGDFVAPQALAAFARASAALGRAFAALRASQWVHFALLPLAVTVAPTGRRVDAPTLGLATLAAAGCLAYAYGLNAWADRLTDRCVVKNPLVGARPSRLVTVVIAGSALLALSLGVLLGWTSLAAATTSLAFATVYSVGPRLKAMPVLGTLANGALFVPLLVLGSPAGEPLRVHPTLVFSFLVLLTQNQLAHEVADLAEDAAAAVTTTARWLGPTAARRCGFALGALGACALLVGGGPLATVAAVVVLVGGLFILNRRTADPAAVRRWHRWYALASGAGLFLMALGQAGS